MIFCVTRANFINEQHIRGKAEVSPESTQLTPRKKASYRTKMHVPLTRAIPFTKGRYNFHKQSDNFHQLSQPVCTTYTTPKAKVSPLKDEAFTEGTFENLSSGFNTYSTFAKITFSKNFVLSPKCYFHCNLHGERERKKADLTPLFHLCSPDLMKGRRKVGESC